MELHCAECGKHMATLRDAKIRNGLEALCAPCYDRIKRQQSGASRGEIPNPLKDLFWGWMK